MIVLVALAPLFRYVPEATLGGIVLVAAAGLVAREELRSIRRQKYQDWTFGLVTLGAVLVVGTLDGILVGVAVSLLTLFWQLNHAPIVVLGRVPGTDRFRSIQDHPGDELIAGMLIVRIESPVYFGNAQRVCDRIAVLVDSSDPRPGVRGPTGCGAHVPLAVLRAHRGSHIEGMCVWRPRHRRVAS